MRIFFIAAVICHAALYAQQPIILWDLHGVLLARKSSIIAGTTCPALPGMVKELSWPLIKDLLSMLYNDYLADTLNSQDFIMVTQKHNAQAMREFILAMVNAQKPMPGMQNIVRELCNLGYRQQIASNIGKNSFESLTNPHLSPELAPIFCALELDNTQITQHSNGQLIKKPNPAFFLNYLAKNNIDLTTQPVLFIDDTEANIITAKKLGFDTILFKNPYQLRSELIKRGFAINPPLYHITNQRNKTILGTIFHHD